MNYFIEQYVDRKGNLLQTKPLPIDKKPEKVNQFRKSQRKTGHIGQDNGHVRYFIGQQRD